MRTVVAPVLKAIFVSVCLLAVPRAASAQELVHSFIDVAVSPDGTRLALVEQVKDGDGMMVRSNLLISTIDGDDAVVVDSVPACTGSLSNVSWSPDGTVLTYVRVRVNTTGGATWENTPEFRVRVLNADGERGRTVIRSDLYLTGPVFTHDGQSIMYNQQDSEGKRSLRCVGLDGKNDREVLGTLLDPARPRRLERGEYFTFASEAIKADGTLNTDEDRRVICAVKADGTGLAQVASWPDTRGVNLTDAVLNRDGSRMIVEGVNFIQTGHVWQVWGIAQQVKELTSPANRGAFSLSPDGTFAIFCAGADESDTLYHCDLGGIPYPLTLQRATPDALFKPFLIEDEEGDAGGAPADAAQRTFGSVTISPDGERVVFAWEVHGSDGLVTTSELWSMRPSGTDLTRLTEGEIDSSPRFGPSGREVVYTRAVKTEHGLQHDVHVIDVYSLEERVATNTPDDETQPAFGANEGVLLFRRTAADKPNEPTLVVRTGDKDETLVDASFDPSSPFYVSTVDSYFFSSRAIDAAGKVAEGNRHLAVTSGPGSAPKSWRSSTGTPVDLTQFRASRDGSRLLTVMHATDRDYLYMEESSLAATNSGPIGRIQSFSSYDLSPNGRRFVFIGTTAEEDAIALPGLWVVDWEAGSFTRVTPGERAEVPSGKPPSTPWVQDGEQDAADEAPSLEQLNDSTDRVVYTNPCFSPDGKQLLVVQEKREGGTDIRLSSTLAIANLNGGDVRDVATGRALSGARWSPDGSRVVFQMSPDIDDDTEVYVCNADGTGLDRITENTVQDGEACFSPDGKGVEFIRRARSDEAGELIRFDLAARSEKVILGKDFEPSWPTSWSKMSMTIVRTKLVDSEGALLKDGAGYCISAVDSDGVPRPVFTYPAEDTVHVPHSLRMGAEKPIYCVRAKAIDEDYVVFVDETVDTKSGMVINQCHVQDDQYDMSPDSRLIAFFGTRTLDDPQELPGLWMMGTDGKDARLFTLRR